MTYLARYTKTPKEVIDYDIDFSAWLAGRGDTIASYTEECDFGAYLTTSELLGGTKVRGFVGGGKDGKSYAIEAVVTTTGGRTKTGRILVIVRGKGLAEGQPIDAGTVGGLTNLIPIDGGEA